MLVRLQVGCRCGCVDGWMDERVRRELRTSIFRIWSRPNETRVGQAAGRQRAGRGQAEAQRRLLTSPLARPPSLLHLCRSASSRHRPSLRLGVQHAPLAHLWLFALPSPSYFSTTVSTSSDHPAACIRLSHPCIRLHARDSIHPSIHPRVHPFAHPEHPYPPGGNRDPSPAVIHTSCVYLVVASPGQEL